MWPVRRPAGWLETVNDMLEARSLQALRTSVNRGRPYGRPEWIQRTAAKLGLGFPIRGAGRPRKPARNQ